MGRPDDPNPNLVVGASHKYPSVPRRAHPGAYNFTRAVVPQSQSFTGSDAITTIHEPQIGMYRRPENQNSITASIVLSGPVQAGTTR